MPVGTRPATPTDISTPSWASRPDAARSMESWAREEGRSTSLTSCWARSLSLPGCTSQKAIGSGLQRGKTSAFGRAPEPHSRAVGGTERLEHVMTTQELRAPGRAERLS